MPNLRYCVAFVLALWAGATQSATITFDSAAPGTFLTAPYNESGFTMSLDSGHYDFLNNLGTNYLNIDEVNFGPAKVSFAPTGGGTFDLINLDVIAAGNGLLTSSKGGSLSLTNTGALNLSGPEWSGITSFSLATTSAE